MKRARKPMIDCVTSALKKVKDESLITYVGKKIDNETLKALFQAQSNYDVEVVALENDGMEFIKLRNALGREAVAHQSRSRKCVTWMYFPERGSDQRNDTTLQPNHFYDPNNQRIFKAMQEVDTANEPIDVVTVITEIGNNYLSHIGGRSHLTKIMNSLPSTEPFKTYDDH